MEITLKNVKHMPSMSEETECFTATVYVDGKKFCTVANEGHGGDTYSRDADYDKVHELMLQINPNCVRKYDDVNKDEKLDWPYPDNWYTFASMTSASVFECAVGDALTKFLIDKDIKNDLRHRFVCIDDDAKIHLYPKKQFGEMTIDQIKAGIERHAKRALEIINGWDMADIRAAYELDAQS